MRTMLKMIRLFLDYLLYELSGKTRAIPLQTVNNPAAPVHKGDSRFKVREDASLTNESKTGEAQILLLGDLMCQRKQQLACKKESGYDFSGSFDAVKPLFNKADLVVGNLETIVSHSLPNMDDCPFSEGLPHLNAPHEWLTAIREAGIDALVSANNHNCDGGKNGILQTLQNIRNAGIPVTGIFDGSEKKRYLLIDVNGIRVAVLAYATWYNFKDCYMSKKDRNTMLNLYSAAKAKKDIAAAKKDGADFVITYMHWGIEYKHYVSKRQQKMAKQLVAAGCDLIAGSHVHVLQAFDYVNGKPCLYSFGNFISSQTMDGTQDTVILNVNLKKENGKTQACVSGIPCCTIVTKEDTDHHTVPVTKDSDPKDFNRITAVLGNKLSM